MKVYLVFYKYHYENKSAYTDEVSIKHVREGNGIVPKVFTKYEDAVEAARICYQDRLDYVLSSTASRVSDEFFDNGRFYIESHDGQYYVSGYVHGVVSYNGRE